MDKAANKKYEGTFMDFEIKDGILIATYKEDTFIDKAAAVISVKERLEFSEYKDMPALVIATNVKVVTKEARNYFGSPEGSSLLKASGIYSNSVLATYIANFLISVNLHKSIVPVKLFLNKEKAIEWLKEYR